MTRSRDGAKGGPMVTTGEFVVVWRLRGHGRDVRCLRQKTLSGAELSILWGDQLFLTERFQDEQRLLARAEEFRRTLEARGWQPTLSGPVAVARSSTAATSESGGVRAERRAAVPERLAPGAERRPTVLVVDDEDDIRTFLRGYLEASGYLVCEAANVDAALSALDEAPVDAVVLDARMPDPRGWGRSGLEVLSYIRLHSAMAALPVMVLTGGALDQEEQSSVRKLRAEVFPKSNGFHSLLRQLDRVTGSSELSDEQQTT